MARWTVSVAVALGAGGIGLALIGERSVLPVASAATGEHAYFDALVARSDHWKSFSLRDPAQLTHRRQGGFAHSNSTPLWVTYNPAGDPHPERQDAAKSVIPPWADRETMLKDPIGPTATQIRLSDLNGDVTRANSGFNSKHRQIRIGDEVLIATPWNPPCSVKDCAPLDRSTGVLNVLRGQAGTTARSHSAGTPVLMSNNNLLNQIRVPIGTSDGYTYLFTWDSYHTRSYLDTGLLNHKAFQLASDGIWLEPQTRFDGGGGGGARCFDRTTHVAGIEARSYNEMGGAAAWSQADGNRLGPGAVNRHPIRPKIGEFCMYPSRWTRWWVLIEQRANDYDSMSMWVADEVQNPVQIYDRVPLSVRADGSEPSTIEAWWIEQNTSTDELTGSRASDFRDLVSYIRNLVVLRNPTNVSQLLVRPAAGLSPPPSSTPAAPGAPSNVRIIR